MSLVKGVPNSEFSERFVQAMANRMAQAYYKYGRLSDAYPHKIDAISSAFARVDKYMETGNTEFLIDAANFLMIEFMYPRKEGAFYKPTSEKESPGRIWIEDGESRQDGNKER